MDRWRLKPRAPQDKTSTIDLCVDCVECKLAEQHFSVPMKVLFILAATIATKGPYMYCEECGVVLMDQENDVKHVTAFHLEGMSTAISTIPFHCLPARVENEDDYCKHLEDRGVREYACM